MRRPPPALVPGCVRVRVRARWRRWWGVGGAGLGGGPLLIKLIGGVEVFGRVMRMRVHTWRLGGGLRPVVLAAGAGAVPRRAAAAAAAVRRALPFHHPSVLVSASARTHRERRDATRRPAPACTRRESAVGLGASHVPQRLTGAGAK